MYGRMMHPVQGELAYQPYGTEGQAIYSVSRGNLNIQLLELADTQDNIHLYFNHKCVDMDYEKGIGYFENEKGEKTELYRRSHYRYSTALMLQQGTVCR